MKLEITKSIKENLNAIKLILFGSYVYGEATIDSDIDLMIVEENLNSKIKELKKARKALRHIDYSKDITVVSDEEFEFYKNEFGSVHKEVCNKGKLLYDAEKKI